MALFFQNRPFHGNRRHLDLGYMNFSEVFWGNVYMVESRQIGLLLSNKLCYWNADVSRCIHRFKVKRLNLFLQFILRLVMKPLSSYRSPKKTKFCLNIRVRLFPWALGTNQKQPAASSANHELVYISSARLRQYFGNFRGCFLNSGGIRETVYFFGSIHWSLKTFHCFKFLPKGELSLIICLSNVFLFLKKSAMYKFSLT